MKCFYETIIIGGGAAGLFCGAMLQKHKGDFLILEKSKKPGIKLLAAGAGQCNFTHGGDIKQFIHFYGDQGTKIRSILYKFNNQMCESYFQREGVSTITREDGKVFPKSLKAEDIRQVLLNNIKKNNGYIVCESNVTLIEQGTNTRFEIECEDAKKTTIRYTCNQLVIACGGMTYPKTGSDGSLIPVLQAFDHFELRKQTPALAPIYVKNYSYASLAGVSIKQAKIKMKTHSSRGDLLFTHKNLSGPLLLNFSRYLQKEDVFTIDFLPDGFVNGDHLQVSGKQQSVVNYIVEETKLAKAFIEHILTLCGIDLKKKASSLSGAEVKKIEQYLHHHEFQVEKLASVHDAMVTCGGICLKEVSIKTLESKKHPGLYFIGEVLDVDGDTGGYNIQFAFSCGYVVAKAIESLY